MRAAVVAVLALCCAVGAAGCSASSSRDSRAGTAAPSAPAASAPAASSRPSASSEASASSATSSPQPPVLPAAAREHTQAGATAFVRFYLDAVQYGFMTGDTSVFMRYSKETCTSCQREKDQIDKQYANGGSFRGGEVTINTIVAAPIDVNGSIVAFTYHQAPIELLDADGHVVAVGDASDEPLTEFYAGWTSAGWINFETKLAPS